MQLLLLTNFDDKMTTWLVLLVVGWIKILYFGRLAFVFSFDARKRVAVL